MRASASATVASGAYDDRLGRHDRARGALGVREQLPHRLGLVGLHQVEQRLLLPLGQLGEQVGGVVRVHLLQDVGGALRRQRGDDLDLVVLGQLLEHVGEALVVQRGGDLEAGVLARSCSALARSAGRRSCRTASSAAVPWWSPCRRGRARSPHSSWRSCPRRVSRPLYSRTATRVSDQSPAGRPPSRRRRRWPRAGPDDRDPAVQQSSSTSSSPGRFSNRRRLSVPVPSTTASASIAVDPADRQEDPPAQRHLGDQADTRGGAAARGRATASRTRPTWSPFGSKTGMPATRATKMRVAVVTRTA
jgi:hypothetical protein